MTTRKESRCLPEKRTLAAFYLAVGVCAYLLLGGCLPVPPPWATPQVSTHGGAPVSPAAGAEWVNPRDGAVYVYVPAGPFLMGGTEEQIAAFHDKFYRDASAYALTQITQTVVNLDGFWIKQTPVTVEDYQRCIVAGVCPDLAITENLQMLQELDLMQHPVMYAPEALDAYAS